MHTSSFLWTRFYEMPIVGIARNIPAAVLEEILPVYQQAGLTNLEITMNSAGCEESIRMAVERFGDSINIGAGTVCTVEELALALNAGARFIVTPVVNVSVIEACRRSNVPVFPGAYTPTEIFTAWNAGADMVKVFPASGNGLEFIRQVRGPFPQIKLLPTGGVDLTNCAAFFNAGAKGVGIGSQLFDKRCIAQKDWNGLLAHFHAYTRQVRECLTYDS